MQQLTKDQVLIAKVVASSHPHGCALQRASEKADANCYTDAIATGEALGFSFAEISGIMYGWDAGGSPVQRYVQRYVLGECYANIDWCHGRDLGIACRRAVGLPVWEG